MRVLLLDNHDSFTWNLAQSLEGLGAGVDVVLSDRIRTDEVTPERWDAIVISPGPGRPEDAGISVALVRTCFERLPILGVCLGHQAIAEAFGGEIVRARELVHGKASAVRHDGRGLFAGLENPFDAARYHSLVADPARLPPALEACAWTEDGTIMGLRHRERPLHGVQFHPESILTVLGTPLLKNFLALAADRVGTR